MEKLAQRLAFRIHSANPGAAPIPVLTNGLTYMLMSLFIVGASLFVGFLTGHIEETIVCLISFSTLRRLTGGRHMKTINQCVVFSTLLMIMLAHIHLQNDVIVWGMNLFSLVIVLFAPTHVSKEGKARRNERRLLKTLAAVLVCSNFLFANAQAALAFTAQGFLLIPGRKEEREI